MGCDCHFFIEYRNGNGPWIADEHHVLEPDGYIREVEAAGRNYELFAALAGVRGDGPDPKGIPDDISPTVKVAFDHAGNDFHSHSWCTPEEFKKILIKLKYKKVKNSIAFYTLVFAKKRRWYPGFYSIINYCKKLKKIKNLDKILLGKKYSSDVQVRLVFAFDN